jgi:hypothetical protein
MPITARVPRFLALAWLAGAATSAPARADALAIGAAPCTDGRIVTEGELPPEWASELSRVCAELSSWPNVDPAARLRVRAGPSGLEIDVQLSDGRTARRNVREPGDLLLTLEALVSLPAPPPRTEPVARRTTDAPPPPPVADRPPAPAASVGIEISGAGTGRLSGKPGYVSAGFEGGAGLGVGHWMLGLVARWDAWQVPTSTSPPLFEMDTLGAGFTVARRERVTESLHLDAGATTMLVTESQSAQAGTGERAGSTTDARLGLVGRAHWGKSPLRGMLLLEGEVSPARLRRTLRIDDQLPALPAWSLGLGAGVSWGEP